MSMYLAQAHLSGLATTTEERRLRHRRIADAAARAAVDHWRRAR